jgi:sarcosine oxidase subunit gamma
MASLSERAVERQAAVRGEAPPGFPAEPNTTAEVGGWTVLWLGPDEWLVLGGSEADFPEAAAAVDVSANRVVLELAGADAAGVLARGCSLDLDRSVFGPGRCAQTLLAGTEVVLVRLADDRFRLLVRPSFAPYLRAWLADAIALGGV